MTGVEAALMEARRVGVGRRRCRDHSILESFKYNKCIEELITEIWNNKQLCIVNPQRLKMKFKGLHIDQTTNPNCGEWRIFYRHFFNSGIEAKKLDQLED